MSYPTSTEKPGAVATGAAIRAGDLSLQEAMKLEIARLERRDAHVNAGVVSVSDRARETAKAMNGTMPPHDQPPFGFAMTVQGSFDVAAPLPSCGQERFARQIAARDSESVRRWNGTDREFIPATWATAKILHG